MKKILSSLLSVLLFVSLFSCSQKSYRDDLACKDVSSKLSDFASVNGGYEEYTTESIELLFEKSELYDDFSVIYSIEVNDINEIGIFHSSSEYQAKKLLKEVENYLIDMQENQRAFIASYAPREVPKLEKATARKYGNYVIYAILDEGAQESLFDTAQELLKK